ncbi:MAG TPA: hypothetical protein VD966_11405 [Pyrinomonadaceae bacterium]|nr:hypothetical protein [Pyrinomonadaceae bacterium]
MDQLTSLLLRHFEDRGDFNIDDLVYVYGDSRQALLHFRVFWPELIKVCGRVVLKSTVESEGGPDALTALLKERPDESLEILAGYRWVEVPYLFSNDGDLKDEHHYLAQLMAETWKGALLLQFPEQKWTTRVLEPEETGEVVGVCFEEAE